MIRILHVADLHLGKTIHERDIAADQRHMLDFILRTAIQSAADLFLIAGDVYDRSIPPPEAVRLFDDFLSGLFRARPDLPIVIIPGNHDSASRLSFGARILSRSGLHIRTSPADILHPVEFMKEGQRIQIWALPFLGAGTILPAIPESRSVDQRVRLEPNTSAIINKGLESIGRGKRADPVSSFIIDSQTSQPPEAVSGEERTGFRSQSALVASALDSIRSLRDSEALQVLLAHCFVTGGSPSESERSFVGLAEQVEASLFEGFDYVALGHLHRCQSPGESGRIHYPGSPLAYSFGESGQEKGLLLADLDGTECRLDFLPCPPLRRMRRLRGSFVDLSAGFDVKSEDYIEAILTDKDPVMNPLESLRLRYPNILAVRQEAFELASAGGYGSGGTESALSEAPSGSGDARLDPLAVVVTDFEAFHRAVRDKEPDERLRSLFASLAEEASHAAP